MKRFLIAAVAAAGATNALAGTMAEYDGRCLFLHFGNKVYDGKCHFAMGPENASGLVFVHRIQPAKGEEKEIRSWTGGTTVNGVPAMQVAEDPAKPYMRIVTAEGDDLLLTKPPKDLGM